MPLVFPLPSWPLSLFPHAHVFPSWSIASENNLPALTCMAFSPVSTLDPVEGSHTRTGTDEKLVVLLPSWPLLLFPQA